jgi:hypothetical protein
MKFKITIRRIERREHTFEVEAKSAAEAQDLALENSADHDFGEDRVLHSEEEVVHIHKINK